MMRPYHHRLFGYSPDAVARASAELEESHAATVRQLQAELAQVRAETDAAYERLPELEKGLRDTSLRLRQATARAAAHLTEGTTAVRRAQESASRADAQFSAEVARLSDILARLSDERRRLTVDVSSLKLRYREMATTIRRSVPGASEIAAGALAGALPGGQSQAKESVG